MVARVLACCLGPVTAIIAAGTIIHILNYHYFQGEGVENFVWTAAKISSMLTIMFCLMWWFSEPFLWTV